MSIEKVWTRVYRVHASEDITMSNSRKDNAIEAMYRKGNDVVKSELWDKLTRPHRMLIEILTRRTAETNHRIFQPPGAGASAWDLLITGEVAPTSYDRRLRLWVMAISKVLPLNHIGLWTEHSPALTPVNIVRIQSWTDFAGKVNSDELVSNLFRDIFQNPYKSHGLPTSFRKCIRCEGTGYESSAPDPDWRVVNGPSDGACSSCDGHGVTNDGPCPWLTYDNGRVFEAANRIYETEEFDKLPYLADLLDDVIGILGGGDVVCPNCNGLNAPGLCIGCNGNKTIPHPILGHLRDTTKPHVRGCWAIDQLSVMR